MSAVPVRPPKRVNVLFQPDDESLTYPIVAAVSVANEHGSILISVSRQNFELLMRLSDPQPKLSAKEKDGRVMEKSYGETSNLVTIIVISILLTAIAVYAEQPQSA